LSESRDRYVAVDKTKVVRCKWCGTAQSDNWILEPGGPWCSWECEESYRHDIGIPAGPFILCCASLLVLPVLFIIGHQPPPFVLIAGVFFGSWTCFFALVWFLEMRESNGTKVKVPKDSRRSDIVAGGELFDCGHCGGCLEVTTNATVTECSYCGFTNEIVRH
jgi:hypothetical protein